MAENDDLFELTPFERTIKSDKRWKWVWDDATNTLAGYVRHSNGYTEMRNRNGKIVYTDEIPIHPSLISPIDFVGAGPLYAAFRPLLGRGVVRLSGMIARAGARRAVANAAIAELRAGLMKPLLAGGLRYRLIDAISRQFPTYKATVIGLCKLLNDGKLWKIAQSLGIDLSKIARM
ncbi:MAG: hypothetical protein WD875_11040 [Pirellulales bacterium]